MLLMSMAPGQLSLDLGHLSSEYKGMRFPLVWR